MPDLTPDELIEALEQALHDALGRRGAVMSEQDKASFAAFSDRCRAKWAADAEDGKSDT